MNGIRKGENYTWSSTAQSFKLIGTFKALKVKYNEAIK